MSESRSSDVRRTYWKHRVSQRPALFIRVSPEERERLKAAAKVRGKSLASWCRQILLHYAEESA